MNRRVEEFLGSLRVEVPDQLGGVFDVGKQDGHLLAFAFQGATGGENFLGLRTMWRRLDVPAIC
jgi:hypothetical protein